MTDHIATPRVVVIGGGYAGTIAANHLRMRSDIDITLVNPRPRFVERIRLHNFVASARDVTADYGSLLGKGVRLVVDTAARIDTVARQVRLASGRALDYDYVIYAVGSTGATPSSVPGAAEFGYPIAELELATRLRAAIEDTDPVAPITVVGGGLTGIETAAELSEQGRPVTLVCGGRLAPTFSEPARRSIAKWLTRNGVVLLEADVVTEVRSDAVVFADGTERSSAVTIWAAGFSVPELAAHSGLRTDSLGRLYTDETLTSVDDDRIVAAGDAASPSGQPLRMSCYAAAPLGITAADTVLSRIAGTEPAPFDMAYVGASVSLGRRSATGQFTHKDDTPLNWHFGGRMAAAIKEVACRATLWTIRLEGRRPGSTAWPTGGPRPDPSLHPQLPTASSAP
jgi:NADH:ubiquinone reductase (H+-translocating)